MTEREEFHIDSDSGANWLLRKLANIEAEKARIQAQAAEMVRKLDTEAECLRHLYEGELVAYARQRLAKAGRGRRAYQTLQGSIALRFVSASVRVSNPFAALDYAQKAVPNLVRTQVTIDQAGYHHQTAKHFKATGELFPGIETTPARETHRLTFGKE